MMADYRLHTLLSAAGLVIGGILLLFFNLDLFSAYEPGAQYVLAVIVALAGGGFFVAYFSDNPNWWRIIPGWTLLALAGMIFASTAPRLDQRITAALLFIGLALAFAHIFLLDRATHWWAIIPSGFMAVLAVVIAANVFIQRAATLDTMLFVGMGLVFFILYALTEKRHQWWALIPGTVLLVFGLFVFTADGGGERTALRWWPLLLVLAGLFFGWRAWRRPALHKLATHSAPSARRAASKPSATKSSSTNQTDRTAPANLGDYTCPAPGASIEILPDPDKE